MLFFRPTHHFLQKFSLLDLTLSLSLIFSLSFSFSTIFPSLSLSRFQSAASIFCFFTCSDPPFLLPPSRYKLEHVLQQSFECLSRQGRKRKSDRGSGKERKMRGNRKRRKRNKKRDKLSVCNLFTS